MALDDARAPFKDPLAGKTVVVIGASSGIGLATSRQAATRSARVVMVGRSMDRLTRAAESVDGEPVLQVVDGLDDEAVDRLFAELGSVDHVVVTAVADETRLFAPIAAMPEHTARRGMEKFWTSMHVARAAARVLRPDGSITLTSSTGIIKPSSGGASVMNAASAAVAAFGRALAVELAPVRVNIVAPGVVNSGVWEDSERARLHEWGRSSLPVGHLGEPDELAAAYLFLMTATYVTGVVLPVDGGLTLT